VCGPVQAPGGPKNPFLKTAAAAEKMTNLAAPSTGVGEGGRDACKVECGTGPSQGGPVGDGKGRSLDQPTTPQAVSTRELASFQIWAPPKPPTAVRFWVILLLLGCKFIAVRSGTGHQPFRWTLALMEDSKVIHTNITPGTPTFVVTNCNLLGPTLGEQCHKSWGKGTCSPNLKDTYWYPSSNPGRGYCNFPGHFYCAYWGCETTATGWGVTIKDVNLSPR